MTAHVREILDIAESLPPRQLAKVLAYARSLTPQSRSSSKGKARKDDKVKDGDAEWERIINDPRPRPKLAAVANRIKNEIRSGVHFEPMDVEQL